MMLLIMGGSYAVWRSKGWGAGGARWWGGPGKWIAVYFLCAVVPMRSVAECLKMLVDYEGELADSVSNAALGRKLMQCKIPVEQRAAVGSCASFHEDATAAQGGVPPFIMGLALRRALFEDAIAVSVYLSMVAAWWAVMWVVASLRAWAHRPKQGAGGNKAVPAEAAPDVAATPVAATRSAAEAPAEPVAATPAEPAAVAAPAAPAATRAPQPEITPAEHQPSGIVDELTSRLKAGVSGKLAEASKNLKNKLPDVASGVLNKLHSKIPGARFAKLMLKTAVPGSGAALKALNILKNVAKKS